MLEMCKKICQYSAACRAIYILSVNHAALEGLAPAVTVIYLKYCALLLGGMAML